MKVFWFRSSRLAALFRKHRHPTIVKERKKSRCGNDSCRKKLVKRDAGAQSPCTQIYSIFWTVTYFNCGHNTPELMCETCETDAVLNFLKKDWRCRKKGCTEGTLMIREDAVKTLLFHGQDGKSSRGLFDEFITFLNTLLCECIVCGESVAEGTYSPTRHCNHARCVCIDCMQAMISSQVAGQDWQNIRCPELKCRRLLSYDDIKVFATQETRDCYEELLTLSALEKMPEFIWCPLAGCTSGQFHASMDIGSSPRVQCIRCKEYSCFKCKDEWHGTQSCEEAAIQNKETNRIRSQFSKRCPGRGCGQYIQKVGGCMEIDCVNTKCRVVFCWECKIILDKSKNYNERSRDGHLENCIAKYVQLKRKGARRYKVAKRPVDGDEKYREGWDVDEDFIGTGQEYD